MLKITNITTFQSSKEYLKAISILLQEGCPFKLWHNHLDTILSPTRDESPQYLVKYYIEWLKKILLEFQKTGILIEGKLKLHLYIKNGFNRVEQYPVFLHVIPEYFYLQYENKIIYEFEINSYISNT